MINSYDALLKAMFGKDYQPWTPSKSLQSAHTSKHNGMFTKNYADKRQCKWHTHLGKRK